MSPACASSFSPKYELIVRVSVFSVTKYFASLHMQYFMRGRESGVERRGVEGKYSCLGTINSNQTMLSNPICVCATETGLQAVTEQERGGRERAKLTVSNAVCCSQRL